MTKPQKKTGLSRSAFLAEHQIPLSDDRLIAVLLKGRMTLVELKEVFSYPEKEIETHLRDMQNRGVLVHLQGDAWRAERQPYIQDRGLEYTYTSRKDNSYVFGLVSDTHLGSKYERLDVLNDLYDRFEALGVDRVFHGGNWIDGECRLNRHELHTFGLDNQCRYVVENYPQRKGIQTFAISGDCHEGWYGKDAKIDAGRYLERMMQEAGRTDWVDLGFLECYVSLKNANSGKATQLLIMHPGGGTAYAISYKIQKIVESLSGGEKPSILCVGHYHKAEYIPIRNVHVFQMGCTQDQGSWARKNRIEPVVGGWVVRVLQEPKKGVVYGCCGEWFHYFNKGYYNKRWSPFGPIQKGKRERVPE